mgnify:CR=1 FL=1|tara:strand:- start:42 stop:230 length:189 start_codon:yes stop_codon:yes gene_type:complete
MILDELIKDYIDNYPKNGFPMELIFALGEDKAIEVLKLREGREIKWITAGDNTRDGGEYIYI